MSECVCVSLFRQQWVMKMRMKMQWRWKKRKRRKSLLLTLTVSLPFSSPTDQLKVQNERGEAERRRKLVGPEWLASIILS